MRVCVLRQPCDVLHVFQAFSAVVGQEAGCLQKVAQHCAGLVSFSPMCSSCVLPGVSHAITPLSRCRLFALLLHKPTSYCWLLLAHLVCCMAV